MPQEIERKFKVTGDYIPEVESSVRITQGYLSSVPERTVRVRIKGNQGYITIKGKGDDSGVCRYEWEREIPLTEAEELLLLCEPGVIDKVRHHIPAGEHLFEVDEFRGTNQGLVVAEIELNYIDEQFVRPLWLGEEVTGESRYYNASLSNYPYSQWSITEK